MGNILDKSKILCSGCSACSVVCPHKAIEIKLNNDGFYEAGVINEKCVSCGICKKVCMKFGNDIKELFYETALNRDTIYAGYSKNDKCRMSSTSGGIAYELTNYYIKKGYIAYGVVYNNKKNRAEHIAIDKIGDAGKFSGSKYLQSYIKETLEEINLDKNGIIFGTPCQIYGVDKYLKYRGVRGKFILVELFCYGVPSYLVWNKYIKYVEDKYSIKGIKNVLFREKNLGWENYSMVIQSREKDYRKHKFKDLFYKFFLSAICLNKVCYTCPFKKGSAYSDVKIGDFWGQRYKDDQKGVSLIVSNTTIGDKAIENLKGKCSIEKACEDDFLNAQNFKGWKEHKNRAIAFDMLRNKETRLVEVYRKTLMVDDLKWNLVYNFKKMIPAKVRSFMKNNKRKKLV